MFPLLFKKRARERIIFKIHPHPSLPPKGEGIFNLNQMQFLLIKFCPFFDFRKKPIKSLSLYLKKAINTYTRYLLNKATTTHIKKAPVGAFSYDQNLLMRIPIE